MTRKLDRHLARRWGIIEAFNLLLSMTIETRDNEWLWRIMALDGPFDVSAWKEFKADVEVQQMRVRALKHYEVLTADWPNVTA